MSSGCKCNKKAAENLGPLIQTLQLTHPTYKFSFVPIIIGALGTIPKDLHENIRQLDFKKKESNDIIKPIQQRAIIGTIKTCKI